MESTVETWLQSETILQTNRNTIVVRTERKTSMNLDKTSWKQEEARVKELPKSIKSKLSETHSAKLMLKKKFSMSVFKSD